jgi:photosystem II stability/assembly factor-like uncharacterized protein
MNRQQFLMFGLALAAAPAMTGFGPPQVVPKPLESANDTQLRLGADGGIERSTDGGRTWARQASFGPEVTVRELRVSDGQWQARLSFRDVEFWLHSDNGRTWFTPGSRRRKARVGLQ